VDYALKIAAVVQGIACMVAVIAFGIGLLSIIMLIRGG
jgi:hypothetical protein